MHKHLRLIPVHLQCVCVCVCVRKHALACLKCHVVLVLVFQLDAACSFSSLQVMFRGVPEPLAGCVITADCLTNSQITGRPHRKHRERERERESTVYSPSSLFQVSLCMSARSI